MSHLWLPRSSKALRKTEEERTEAEQSVQQQQKLSESGASDDPASEPSAKLRQKAQVWKTYLKETDRWDKEMVEERNKFLLASSIQAALFSAISTTFVVESLGHLQPDPAESSAQTLLVISQTLMAMANNQSVSLVTQHPAVPNPSPSPAQLVVNILWVLSLSLSVAVSLIAMLAKDWCYKFMFGRTGQVYEQARRRQQRWNGMEKWKMKQLLTYLPGMMHTALSLFAIGLCVYLWEINISVAIPVIIITALATWVYVAATILPLMDQFCPYNTSTTAVLVASKPIFSFLYDALIMVAVMFAFLLFMLLACVIPDKWLEEAQETVQETAQDAMDAMQATLGLESNRSLLVKSEVPMDMVTSQMLAWIITNCEDSRSVDVALQAIAGAGHELPYEPLAQCSARDLIIQRIKQCVLWDPLSGKIVVKEARIMPEALIYCGAYSVLVSREKYKSDRDGWNSTADEMKIHNGREYEDLQIMKVVVEILEHATRESETSGIVTSNMLAATAAAAMPFCHWNWNPSTSLDHKYIAPSAASSILKRHLQTSNAVLSTSTLHALVESTMHYLVGLWPNEDQHAPCGLLIIQLAQVYSASRDTAPDTARAAAVVLAATALAVDSYPGGEQPPKDFNTREQRALSLLDHYRANKPTNEITTSLFLFGFIGLLPHLSFRNLDSSSNIGADLLRQVKKSVAPYNFKDTHSEIYTLPSAFSLLEHAGLAAWELLTSAGGENFPIEDESIAAFACSSFLATRENLQNLYPRLYGVALIALQRARTKELQDVCIKLVDAQPLPNDPLQFFGWFGSESLLHQLCRTLPGAQEPGAHFALHHFRLLVTDLMLAPRYPLERRQSALRPLLSFHHAFSVLTPSNCEPKLSNLDSIVSHISGMDPEEDIIDGMLDTMQLVADFCSPEFAPRFSTNNQGNHDLTVSEWESKRLELRNILRQNRAKDDITEIMEVHPPRIVIQEEAASEKAAYTKKLAVMDRNSDTHTV
ncbi:transmembrane protein [Ceratobasidium sp. AG-Ba]|nr:transmembrane protein [Ceratobasidium sp. AG-Ba]